MKLEEMKESKIFALIAAQPYIRSVQIADAVDLSIEEVEDEILPHLNRGHLVKKDVLAPNQRQVPGYAFSNEFRLTEVYTAIVAAGKTGASTHPPAACSPADTVQSSPELPPDGATGDEAVALSPADDPALRRIERTIAYLKEHGPTTENDLRQMLNMQPQHYLSSYLSRAVKDGRLVKDGKRWSLGAAIAPTPLKTQPPFGRALSLPGSTPRVPTTPSVEVAEAAPAEALPAAPVADTKPPAGHDAAPVSLPAAFRCGRWSDGDVELQRGGHQLAVLTIEECRVIARMVEGVPA